MSAKKKALDIADDVLVEAIELAGSEKTFAGYDHWELEQARDIIFTMLRLEG